MRADCPDCEDYREERATQIRTGRGDLGDLLTRVALHESTPRCMPRSQEPVRPDAEGVPMTTNSTHDRLTPARPWGLGRLRPYPTTVKLPFTTVGLDPASQTGVFRDHLGHVVEMGKHGTSCGTETSTATNLDSQPDQGHDQDSQGD
ncbi:hypothetical protein GCM10010294_01310 [Streptomyces griseoloalbus]|nr:hypothetical protein GCM10010294_01310 [Streptomyces griseoloalbus]